ncbi:MAG TPA: translocation/assembly module TamB domain-containing protein [Bryobacteraceae bacterium]|jgi:translocation and assembly module TamB|nr:translocation/assembly module TamB domain-containing protein [Bryobacteraceae bacterium]
MRSRWWWLAALPVVLFAGAAFLLQSGWLQEEARREVVSTLERVTGAPVAIREFYFDWRTLTLVCHGIESRSLKIASLEVKLRWRSLWERRVDAAGVVADRPEIDLGTVNANGVPGGNLFAIEVAHYEVVHGIFHFAARQQGFDLRGEDLRAELKRNGAGDAYGFEAASKRVEIASGCCGRMLADVSARGLWRPDSIDLQRFQAAVRADRGELTLEGQGSLRASSGFVAEGAAKGTLQGGRAQARFHYSSGEINFRDIEAELLGGAFRGRASARLDRSWEISGQVKGVALNEALRLYNGRQLPWTSQINGALSGTSANGFDGDLHLTGGLSGELRLHASGQGAIRFSDSRLAIPETELNFSGSRESGFAVTATTSNLDQVRRALSVAGIGGALDSSISFHPGGDATFHGDVRFVRGEPEIAGALVMQQFRAYQREWQRLEWQGEVNRERLKADHVMLTGQGVQLAGSGAVQLQNWAVARSGEIDAAGTFAVPAQALALPVKGLLKGAGEIHGRLVNPTGKLSLELRDGQIYGEKVKVLEAQIGFDGRNIRVSRGRLQDSAGDTLDVSGSYLDKRLDLQVKTSGFVLSHVSGLSGIDGRLAVDARIAAEREAQGFRPVAVDGSLTLSGARFNGKPLGDASGKMQTANGAVQIELRGDLRGNPFSGEASVSLGGQNLLSGTLRFSRIAFQDCLPDGIPASVAASGALHVSGNLLDWRNWAVQAHADALELSARDFPFALHNAAPADFELSRGLVRIEHLDLAGPSTTLNISGSATGNRLDLAAKGEFSLKILQLIDNNIETAEGAALLDASAHGSLDHPSLAGKMQIKDGAIGLRDFSNSLTHLNGSLVFDQNRATIERLTAQAGGGKLALAGFVTFGGAAPLAYHLESHAEDTRLRYANGVSVTTDANLRLTGTSTNSLLSGTARISRVVLNPNADVGNLLTNLAAGALTPANQKAFASGLQFDVAIESAPNLQISTSLSRDVEAAIDLRLRGTPERPLLLGTVSANQGDIRVFGGRYTINRGQVTFQNATRIEPVLDLDLGTQARGINVDITISGTLSHLNIAYRSDPPLQPRDIIALLTVGRTPQEAANVQTSQVSTESSTLAANPTSVLGQAIAPPSGRLSKLFGVTNIKLDPLVQGLTNTPQSRLTLEQQISRSITVTYVTNLEQTSEQIFRLEWAINRQYSIVALRDDNGEFGIDLQYKKRFK